MSTKSNIVSLQEYVFNGLLSCDLFAAYNVVMAREFLAQSQVEFDALWLTPRTAGGPSGIGIYVEMPSLDIDKPNSLQRNLTLGIVVIEERNINMGTAGTGTSAEELAEAVLDFAFGWLLGFSSALTPASGTVRPARDVVEGGGLIVYRASLSLRREHQSTARCDMPLISAVGDGTWTLANGTNTPDAAIYYTLNGYLPGKSVASAVLYSAPVALTTGQTITWAAWRSDRLPSHVQTRTIQ